MFSLQIIAVSTMKNQEFKTLAEEYQARLRPFAKLDTTEIPHIPFRDQSEREKVQAKEAEAILKAAKPNTNQTTRGILVALDERGKEFTSEDFARFLAKQSEQGQKISFVIGGALGLHPSIRTEADHVISLSKMTLPHEFARVMLLEQLYRTATILQGKTYHY